MNLSFFRLFTAFFFLNSLGAACYFIDTRADLAPHYDNENVVLVASPGRSGSTVLTEAVCYSVPYKLTLKTHLLPPNKSFKGKILFVFSDPDLAAESVFHITFLNEVFGKQHFFHLETSDQRWLDNIGSTTNQSISDNLLAYDALGCFDQLHHWLYKDTTPCSYNEAQILAIKYENLWDEATINQIRFFLKSRKFKMPKQLARREARELTEIEEEIINTYNQGTSSAPRYTAYDEARVLWESAPSYQYYKIKN